MGIEFYDATLVHESGVWDKLVWKIKKWDNQSKRYLQKPPRVLGYVVDMIMDYPMGIGPGAWIKLYNGEHYTTGESYTIVEAIQGMTVARIGAKLISTSELGGELMGLGINSFIGTSKLHEDLQKVSNMPSPVNDLAKYYIPKLLPSQYQDFFTSAGIDFSKIIISIDAASYFQGSYGTSIQLDSQWKDFIESNPNATKEDIVLFINSLIQSSHKGITPDYDKRIKGVTIYLTD
jgi:hypothetical protein